MSSSHPWFPYQLNRKKEVADNQTTRIKSEPPKAMTQNKAFSGNETHLSKKKNKPE